MMTLWQKLTAAFFILASVIVALFQTGRKWESQSQQKDDAKRAANLYKNSPKSEDPIEFRDGENE